MANRINNESAFAEKQPWKSATIGYIFRVLAIPLAIIVMVFAQQLLNDSMPLTSTRNNMMAGLLGIAVGVGLWRYGSRHLQPGADEILANDPRPPILYLRSFANETLVGEEEEAIARALEDVGPLVAVGRPGERLPPLGAARMYLTDDSWQGKVEEQMDRARIILVAAGDTPGLGWELRQCAQLADPTKLVIMVPNNANEYDGFARLATEVGLPMPAFPPKQHLKYATTALAALLTFKHDGKPLYVPLPKARGRGPGFNHQFSVNRGGRAWVAMGHVMERIGLKLPEPPLDLGYAFRAYILIMLSPAILLLIAMIAAWILGIFDPYCNGNDQELENCFNWDMIDYYQSLLST